MEASLGQVVTDDEAPRWPLGLGRRLRLVRANRAGVVISRTEAPLVNRGDALIPSPRSSRPSRPSRAGRRGAGAVRGPLSAAYRRCSRCRGCSRQRREEMTMATFVTAMLDGREPYDIYRWAEATLRRPRSPRSDQALQVPHGSRPDNELGSARALARSYYHSAQLDRAADAARDIPSPRIPTAGMPRCCSTARWCARGATRLSGPAAVGHRPGHGRVRSPGPPDLRLRPATVDIPSTSPGRWTWCGTSKRWHTIGMFDLKPWSWAACSVKSPRGPLASGPVTDPLALSRACSASTSSKGTISTAVVTMSARGVRNHRDDLEITTPGQVIAVGLPVPNGTRVAVLVPATMGSASLSATSREPPNDDAGLQRRSALSDRNTPRAGLLARILASVQKASISSWRGSAIVVMTSRYGDDRPRVDAGVQPAATTTRTAAGCGQTDRRRLGLVGDPGDADPAQAHAMARPRHTVRRAVLRAGLRCRLR